MNKEPVVIPPGIVAFKNSVTGEILTFEGQCKGKMDFQPTYTLWASLHLFSAPVSVIYTIEVEGRQFSVGDGITWGTQKFDYPIHSFEWKPDTGLWQMWIDKMSHISCFSDDSNIKKLPSQAGEKEILAAQADWKHFMKDYNEPQLSEQLEGKKQIWRVYPDLSFTGNLNTGYLGNADHAGCHDFNTITEAADYIKVKHKQLRDCLWELLDYNLGDDYSVVTERLLQSRGLQRLIIKAKSLLNK